MKLLEYGWDMRNAQWVGANVSRMDSKPFDGFIFSALLSDATLFHDSFWGTRQISASELSTSLGAMSSSSFTNQKNNFLFIGVKPGIDWFNGFSAVLNNVDVACAFASEAGCSGLFFDLEAYGKHIFEYSSMDYTAKKNLNKYKDQAEFRGYQIVQVMNKYPALEVLLTFAYSQANETNYALLSSFLDGLTSTQGPTQIIDGHEDAYTETSIGAFKARLNNKGLGKFRSPNLSQGALGVSLEDHPTDLTTALTNALNVTDRYVWLYSQSIDWWNAGTNARTTEVLNARSAAGLPTW